MIRRKVCLLGAAGVGKTSLVRRWVESMFSDDYLSTVGVKIDRKRVMVGDTEVTLLIWDIHGENDTLEIRPAYTRAAAAHLVVVDASRPETATVAAGLVDRFARDVPFVLALNKADLVDSWEQPARAVAHLEALAAASLRTSAKEGVEVDQAFTALATAAL